MGGKHDTPLTPVMRASHRAVYTDHRLIAVNRWLLGRLWAVTRPVSVYHDQQFTQGALFLFPPAIEA